MKGKSLEYSSDLGRRSVKERRRRIGQPKKEHMEEPKYQIGDRFVNTTNDLKVEVLEIREIDGTREYGLLALDGKPKSFRNFSWETEAWLNRAIKHQIYLTT